MEMDHYQKLAMKTAAYKDKIVYPVLGLASEAGEVAGKVKKVLRDSEGEFTPEMKKKIAYELGDVLWYIAATAKDIGYNMSSIALLNIEKLSDRAERNVIKGSGDTR